MGKSSRGDARQGGGKRDGAEQNVDGSIRPEDDRL